MTFLKSLGIGAAALASPLLNALDAAAEEPPTQPRPSTVAVAPADGIDQPAPSQPRPIAVSGEQVAAAATLYEEKRDELEFSSQRPFSTRSVVELESRQPPAGAREVAKLHFDESNMSRFYVSRTFVPNRSENDLAFRTPPPRPEQFSEVMQLPTAHPVFGRVSLHDAGSRLMLGRNSELQLTVDPHQANLEVESNDSPVRAYVLRGDIATPNGQFGPSDVELLNQSRHHETQGLEGRLAHYALHGGLVRFGSDQELTAVRYAGGVLDAKNVAGAFFRIKVSERADDGISFGAVSPAFVERANPTTSLQFGKTDGPDAVLLATSLPRTGETETRYTIADAEDQHAIKADASFFITIANPSDEPLDNLDGVYLKLNEPQTRAPRNEAMNRSMPRPMGGAPVAAGGQTEAEVSGMKTIKLFETLEMPANFSQRLNITDSILGGTETGGSTPVTIDQTLSLRQTVSIPPSGEQKSPKANPETRFEITGLSSVQPGGYSVLLEGGEEIADLRSGYVEAGKPVKMRGQSLKSLEIETTTTTLDSRSTDWAPDPQNSRFQLRTTNYELKVEVDVSSKSRHQRDVDMEINVPLDKLENVKVVDSQGNDVPFELVRQTVSFKADQIPGNGSAVFTVTFHGEQAERSLPNRR